MKIAEAERLLKEKLSSIYDEGEARSIADLAMEHITSLSKSDRLLRKEEGLSPHQLQQWQQDTERLLQHEPVQYVMSKAWFYGMELFVNKAVLIPRPETEELVEWIVHEVRAWGKDVFEKRPTEADETRALKILDVGTGSGCIALALKKAMPRAEVWGCDVSEEALNVARRNGAALDIRVDFQGVNFLDDNQQKSLPRIDIVVSNPPYIPLKDKEEMNPNVVAHEPHTALFVPDDNALVFYTALAKFGKQRLHPNGCIYMEIHENLGQAVVRLFQQQGYEHVELKKDMQGKDRMVKAVKAL